MTTLKKEYAIQCFEQRRYEHIFVDEHNKIHVFIPLAAGNEVSLDNTCRATEEFAIFFGNGLTSASVSIARYIFDLECDLSMLATTQPQAKSSNLPASSISDTAASESISTEIKNKTSRLAQLKKQQALLLEIRDHNKNYAPSLYQYPPAIKKALQHTPQPGANCVGISLVPRFPDYYRNIDPLLFSLTIPSYDNDTDHFSGLLLKKITKIEINLKHARQATKEKIVKHAAKIYSQSRQPRKHTVDTEEDLNALKTAIRQALTFAKCDALIELDYSTYARDNEGKKNRRKVDLAYIRSLQLLDEDESVPAAAAAEGILGFVEKLTPTESNPFTRSLIAIKSKKNQKGKTDQYLYSKAVSTLAVKIQFFLATINVYCYERGWTIKNFGKVFEQRRNKKIAKSFVASAATTLVNGDDLANALLDCIVEANQATFEGHEQLLFQGTLTLQDRQNIIDRFTALCTTIDGGDTEVNADTNNHWDEFWILTRAKGNFYSLGSKIGLHLAGYCQNVSDGELFEKYFQGSEALVTTVHSNSESNCLPQNCITEIRVTIDLNHIQQLDSRYIARLLISPAVGKSCKVFADPDFPVSSRQLIQQLPAWQHIYNSLVIQLSQSELQSFNQIWDIKQPTFHVTQAMVEFTAEDPYDDDDLFPYYIHYPSAATNGFDISLSDAKEESNLEKTITFIKKTLEPYSRRIDLMPITLKSLELEVYSRYGVDDIPPQLSRYERIQHLCNRLDIHATRISNFWFSDSIDVTHAEELEHIHNIQNRWEPQIRAANLASHQKFGVLIGWPLFFATIATICLCFLFAMEVIEPFMSGAGSFRGEVISAAVILGAVSIGITGIVLLVRQIYLSLQPVDDLFPLSTAERIFSSLGTLLGTTLMTGLGVGAIAFCMFNFKIFSAIPSISELLFFSKEIMSASIVAGVAAGLAFCITVIALLTYHIRNHMNKKDQDSQPVPNAALTAADATYGISPELVTGAFVIMSDNLSETKVGDSFPVEHVASDDLLNQSDPEKPAVLDEHEPSLSLPEELSQENDDTLPHDYRPSPARFPSPLRGRFGDEKLPDEPAYIPDQSLSS